MFFVPAGGINNASARTRCYAYLPYLNALGIRYHIASYTWHKYDAPRNAGNAFQRILNKLWLELLPLRNVIAFLKADTLFFQKKSFSRRRVNWAKRLGKRIVYDFDDAIYFYPPDSTASQDHRAEYDEAFLPRMEWMLAKCDLALVSGDELARFAVERAHHVQILPSVLEDAVAALPGHHEPPVIGWVGAPENQRYLREIESALGRVQREHPAVEVWIVSSRLMEPPPNFRYKFWPWSLETEANVIPRFTVGIAPLVDDPWCRAKMNFKALVYMSRGVPAVVTPVGFPLDEFEDGRSVLVARSAEDWYRHLKELIVNPARRDEIALAGYEVVRQRFTAAARVAEFAAALMKTTN